MIKHDISPVSVVTTCTECPHWQAFSFDLEEADRRRANHLIAVHGVEPARALEASRKRATRRSRHAV
jgi:hypothetical protein